MTDYRRLADELERLCCAETEGKFFDLVAESAGDIIKGLRLVNGSGEAAEDLAYRPDWPLPSFDAQDWAKAFCKIANEHGYKDAKGEPMDEGWMITWFANALMRGYTQCSAENRVNRR